MEITSLIPYIYDRLILFILVFTRVSAMFSTFILFRRDYVNPRILVAFSSIITIYVVLFYINENIKYDVFSSQTLATLLIQFFIGFLTGFMLNIAFDIFNALGQYVSSIIGLGFASLVDPRLGSVSVLTKFYMILIITVFLQLNGHLIAIKMLLDSFTILPLKASYAPLYLTTDIINYTQMIFSSALLLSLTVLVSIMLTNFALAVMTRFAPQFNLISIGMNMSIVIGLICVLLSYEIFVNNGISLIQQSFSFVKSSLIKLR